MRRRLYIHLLFIFLFLLAGIESGFAQQSGLGMLFNKTPVMLGQSKESRLPKSPVTKKIPLFSKLLRSNGIEADYPFGAGITGFYYSQKFFASSLLLTAVSPITGDTLHAWADTLIQNTHAGEMQMVMKPNLWILPFLNLYGIVGYTSGTVTPNLSASKIVVDFPGIGQQTIDTTLKIMDKLPYHGAVFGGGVTLAFGIRKFFFLLDYYYTETFPTELEGKFVFHSFSPKAGMIFTLNKNFQLDFWVGALYFSNKQTMHGSVDVKDISKTLAMVMGDKANYEGNINPVHTWNFLVGTVLELKRHSSVMVEGGFVNRRQIKVGYEFRF